MFNSKVIKYKLLNTYTDIVVSGATFVTRGFVKATKHLIKINGYSETSFYDTIFDNITKTNIYAEKTAIKYKERISKFYLTANGRSRGSFRRMPPPLNKVSE